MQYSIGRLADKIEERYITPSLGRHPQLAVVMSCSPSPGEISYLKQISRFAEKYDVQLREIRTCDPMCVIEDLSDYKNDGIIRISDFGKNVNRYIDESYYDCRVDLDGVCMKNKAQWLDDDAPLSVFPCTALAAYLAIDEYFTGFLGNKDIAVINRSNTIGKPLSLLLNSKRADANVHMFHSKSLIDNNVLKHMDAIVTATGKPGWFTLDSMTGTALYNALVVDVGVAEKEGKMVGDVCERVDQLDYINVVRSLGRHGIGYLTTTILFAKLFGGFECATLH